MKNLKITLALLLLVGLSGLTTSCESEDNTADLYELDTQDNIDTFAGGEEKDEDNDDPGN